MPQWGSTKPGTLGEGRYMALRAVLDGDRLVGLWEYDPDAGAVVFHTFDALPPKRRRAVQSLAEDVATFLREDVGHARSFTLDSMDTVRERAASIQAMAG
jgi:hypothetical protein